MLKSRQRKKSYGYHVHSVNIPQIHTEAKSKKTTPFSNTNAGLMCIPRACHAAPNKNIEKKLPMVSFFAIDL